MPTSILHPDLHGRVAIVTGASRGIGKALALRLAREGAAVVIAAKSEHSTDRLPGSIHDTAAEIHALGGRALAVPTDVRSEEAVSVMVERTVAEFGRIDILVNNAGINQKRDFTDVSDEDFQRVLHTNLSSVFALSREVVRSMETAGGGVIINISSMAAQYGIPKVIAYSASKSAIEGMTRAMAVELAPKGIRVNCIAPGFIATDMSEKALNGDAERKQKVMSRTPMGRLGEPADIGDAALYLASDGAGYVTGVVLPIDGGNSIGF